MQYLSNVCLVEEVLAIVSLEWVSLEDSAGPVFLTGLFKKHYPGTKENKEQNGYSA